MQHVDDINDPAARGLAAEFQAYVEGVEASARVAEAAICEAGGNGKEASRMGRRIAEAIRDLKLQLPR
jgi:hypothetical protein